MRTATFAEAKAFLISSFHFEPGFILVSSQIVISFSQKGSRNFMKRKDTVNQLDARTVGTKGRLKKESVVLDDNCYVSHAHLRYY